MKKEKGKEGTLKNNKEISNGIIQKKVRHSVDHNHNTDATAS